MHFQVNFETSNYPEIEHPPKYIFLDGEAYSIREKCRIKKSSSLIG